MRINSLTPNIFSPKSLVLYILLTISLSSTAQVVWQDPQSEVYNFLSRQAQKGNIDLFDLIQPLSRKTIAEHLHTLRDSTTNLSLVEKSELKFYLKEFSEFDSTLTTDTLKFLKKDPAGRWRFIYINKGDYLLRGDPVITFRSQQTPGGTVTTFGNGISFFGHFSKNIAFQGYFEDITERGKGIDTLKDFTPEEGIVRTVTLKSNSINYSRLKGYLTYSFKNGSFSVGKDQLLWGYGENGRVVLSNKAPAYPLIRLKYRILKWMELEYSHAWLHSAMIDSARTYPKGNNVFGDFREFYIPKFMASHTLNFYPVKGLSLSVGESMVYSDRLNFAYLIPIMFFKAYDQYDSRYNVPSGSNGQFFFQASSRNHIPKTHLYTTLFVDEIRTTEIFNKNKSRNQLGLNAGASVTDVFTNYLTFGIEYTRINPFVYQNLIPAQNYTSQNYSLGDWMGNNADRLILYAKYNPLPRLKTEVRWQKTRKGASGTVNDQYFAEPQPSFLFGIQHEQTQLQLKASYQWINSLYIDGGIIHNNFNSFTSVPDDNSTQFQFSVRFGL